MTDIERKALELVNEVLAEWGVLKNAVEVPKNSDAFARALLRAIEQHEAFRQEVSDAVTDAVAVINNSEALVACEILERFIIWKPDPLVEVMRDCGFMDIGAAVDDIRAALAKRGLEIREINK